MEIILDTNDVVPPSTVEPEGSTSEITPVFSRRGRGPFMDIGTFLGDRNLRSGLAAAQAEVGEAEAVDAVIPAHYWASNDSHLSIEEATQRARARHNYRAFHNISDEVMDVHEAIQNSSAGWEGWANITPAEPPPPHDPANRHTPTAPAPMNSTAVPTSAAACALVHGSSV